MRKFFAVAAPGVEALTALELHRMGLVSENQRYQNGGVSFEGELEQLYQANLHLRTASRVLVRLGNFHAATFSELRKKARRLPWGNYLSPGQPVTLRVTCRKSRLYHSDAVAERVAGAIGDRIGQPPPLETPTDEDAELYPQLVIVRLWRDQCTISIDSSGSLLHRRGYRLATAKAPLRETLAAAMLLAADWDTTSPLLDPFCGSGTIPIEAALLARGLPPGIRRNFAFMTWPGFDPGLWEALLAETKVLPEAGSPIIQASDRDAGAVRLAQENAERAGVAGDIEFSCRAISAIEPPSEKGWVITNPPYGLRVSANKDLRNLYAQLGNVLRAQCMGWYTAILCSDLRLLGQTGLSLDNSFTLVNGGVRVRLGRGLVK